MKKEKIDIFNGEKIEIIEMLLKCEDGKLVLLWTIKSGTAVHRLYFQNVSRLRIGEVSKPLEIHGFEIINHSQNGWEEDSKYEIRDYEDGRVHFFCECFKIDE